MLSFVSGLTTDTLQALAVRRCLQEAVEKERARAEEAREAVEKERARAEEARAAAASAGNPPPCPPPLPAHPAGYRPVAGVSHQEASQGYRV